jgi:predicted ATPase
MRSEFRDGAFFVDLSTVTDPAMVPLTVAQALRLSVDPGGDALKAVLEYLRGREVLLIIDNFEQVVDAVATVESILAAAPRVRLLVTSRKPLLVYGEQEYEVPPFALPHPEGGLEELTRNPAVALFVDRTCAMKPDFALTEENATAVAGITARLDGLPLAIELAAGRSRALTPQSILSRLDSGLSLLAGRSHSRPDRQQTMRDAIRWSYDLLAPAERPLFARLSVFAGGCSLEAAEAVDDPGDMTIDVLDVLGTLIEQSLLRQVDSPGEEARFAMLETILEFAGERLREEFDPDATQRRFASYFMALAEEAQPHLTTVDQVASLDRCQQEAANLRAAIRWAVAAGEPEIGLRTASALWRFWQQRGPLWEGRQALDQLLELAGPSDAVRARALGAAGSLAWWDGDYGAARRQYEEAVPLSRQGGDRRVEMEALYNLASVVIWSDRAAAADDLIRQSMAIAEEIGDGKGVARAKHGLGFVAIVKGDFRAAISAFEESARMFEDLGERVDLTDAVIALGNVNRRLGENERARTFYLRGLDMTVAAGNRPMSVGLLFLLSSLEADRGRPESAARLWGAGEAARAVIGAVRPAVSERIIGDPITAARLMIGDVAVEAALAEGRRMEPDAAIAYAREDS